MSDDGDASVEVEDVDLDGNEDDGDDNDEVEEVQEESWGDRLGSSCAGICIGLILFFVSFPLLFWNEGRAVKRYVALNEGEALTKSISVNLIDPANEGGLVHFTALAQSTGNVTDPIFGVTINALKLWRNVEMYQWKEITKKKKKKKIGGGTSTTTTYSYVKEWGSSVVSSSEFKTEEGHVNPLEMRFNDFYEVADNITVGAFQVSGTLLHKISWYSPLLGVSKENIPDSKTRAEAKDSSGGDYIVFCDSCTTAHETKYCASPQMATQTRRAVRGRQLNGLTNSTMPLCHPLRVACEDDTDCAGKSSDLYSSMRNYEMCTSECSTPPTPDRIQYCIASHVFEGLKNATEEENPKREREHKTCSSIACTSEDDCAEVKINGLVFDKCENLVCEEFPIRPEVPLNATDVDLAPLDESNITDANNTALIVMNTTDADIDPLDESNTTEVENITRALLDNFSDSNGPAVGDTRVSFESIPSGIISVVAQQNGNAFATYGKGTGEILFVKLGNHSMDELFTEAAEENKIMTWVLRLIGFLVMAMGLYLIMRPIEVFADVIPCAGDIIGCGITIIAIVVAVILSFVVISIAWLIYRPWIGAIVLGSAVLIAAGIVFVVKRQKGKEDSDLETSEHDKAESTQDNDEDAKVKLY